MDITKQLQRNLAKLARMKNGVVKGLHRTLKNIQAEKKKRVADLIEAEQAIVKEIQLWMGSNGKAPKKSTSARAITTKASKRRIRRSPEQLKNEAVKIVAFIRSAGKDGIGGGEIRKKFPGVGQDIRGYIKKHTGQTLKATGKKASMKYHGG